MEPTSTSSSSPDSIGSLKRPLDDNSADESTKRFKCEPCNKYFKEHKSLLRHERENSKHRWQPTNMTSTFTCQLCPKTFARAHDRERHFKEQHHDGKVPCADCGKSMRPKVPHKCSAGTNLHTRHDSVVSESSSATTNTDLSTCQGLPEANHTAIMDKLSDQLNHTSLSSSVVCPSLYKKQVRAAKPNRLLPCGLCRIEFEIHDPTALFQHLKDHMNGFNGAYRCEECEIEFVSASDLEKHLASAEKNDCGFLFHHRSPCTGHHPPPRPKNGPRLLLDSDNDRFSFCYRLRAWEHSQLAAYVYSIKELNRSKINSRHAVSEHVRQLHPSSCHYCQIVEFHRQEIGAIDELGIEPKYSNFDFKRQCPSVRIVDKATSTLMLHLSQPETGSLCWKVKRRSSFSEGCQADTARGHLRYLASKQQRMYKTRRGATAPDPAFFADSWLQLLHRACTSGDLELARSAVSEVKDINGHDLQGNNALHLSVLASAADVAELLLQSGAHISPRNREGKTPLFVALQRGYTDAIQLLIKHGATNLCRACKGSMYGFDHASIVGLLLNAGPDKGRCKECDGLVEQRLKERSSMAAGVFQRLGSMTRRMHMR